jgi:hypothetical protein
MSKLGKIVGINLGIFLVYALLGSAALAWDMILFFYPAHVGILVVSAIGVYIWDAWHEQKLNLGNGLLVSALVILVVGFSWCSVTLLNNYH